MDVQDCRGAGLCADCDSRFVNEGQVNSISGMMLQSASVGTAALMDAAVTERKVADQAVTERTLAPNSVTSEKVQDGTITANDLAFTPGDITAVGAGNGLTGGGASGDVTLHVGQGTGIMVGADVVSVDVGWADGRFVNEGQANSVSRSMIQDSAVDSSRLASSAVTAVKLASDADSLNKVSAGFMTQQGGNTRVHGSFIAETTATLEVAVVNRDLAVGRNLGTSGSVSVAGVVGIDSISGAGVVSTQGPTSWNAGVTFLSGYPDNGYVGVRDSGSNWRAAIYITPQGRGRVFADEKNFVVPSARVPGWSIVYACIEGPEAAAYIRGTGRLVGGRARVELPEHFQEVARAEGMTVQVTPRSASSKGLAVAERDIAYFMVQELQGGTGTYEFDWEVKALRRGFEEYQVLRPSAEFMGFAPDAKPLQGTDHAED